MTSLRPTSLALALVLTATTVAADETPTRLGRIEMPNSGAEAAQPVFMKGLLLLHNFEYEDARAAFREAQTADADFALAYWGEAMTHNHPLWQRQDRDAALEALARLAPTPAERLEKVPTERERDYLAAVEALFGEGDKKARDLDYLEAMRRLDERYPDDLEAAAFHALAVLGTAHEGRDFTLYMRAAAIVEEVFAENPLHPGAAHYLIHSYDDPIHAPLGLRAARVYAEIAPDAAHAQHMTSHIFVALGMWDEVVEANLKARDVQDARRAELGRGPNVCGHYASWLEYGYLQQGRRDEARDLLTACHRRIAEGTDDEAEAWYFARMRARYLFDSGDWDGWALQLSGDLAASPSAEHTYRFTNAYRAVSRGDLVSARRLADEMQPIRARAKDQEDDDSEVLAIQAAELAGLIELASGNREGGLAALRQAADAEQSMPFMFGPPAVVKPAHELLGEALLEGGDAEAALVAFKAALARAPRRTTSLLGLARAAAEIGDEVTAAETYATLEQIWRHAETPPVDTRAGAAERSTSP